MTDFGGFKGRAKRLEDLDLPRIGQKIGVGEDELHAFMDVESSGHGFGPDGRPIILFEPHVFWRNLPKTKRVVSDICYPKWGTRPYPKTQEERYQQLALAMRIDEAAALEGASWGLTQILGENWKACGYPSVQMFVLDMMDDEDNHLEATVELIKAKGIDDDLRAHRWEVVTAAWNGTGQIPVYAPRLKKAFQRWQRIPDTKFTLEMLRDPAARPVAPPPAASAPAPVKETAMRPNALLSQPGSFLAPAANLPQMAGPAGLVLQMLVPALQKAANENGVPLDTHASVVQDAIQEVQQIPEFQHLTGTETAWYQQRSKWAAIIGVGTAIAVPALRLFGVNLNITVETANTLSEFLATAGSAVAAYLAYRAGTASKPLFTSGPDPRDAELAQIKAQMAEISKNLQAQRPTA